MVGPECIVVADVKSEAATITGYAGSVTTTMMLDRDLLFLCSKKINLLSKVSKFVKMWPILTETFDRFWR